MLPCTQVPLFAQRASRRPDGLVVWDYHVFLVQHRMIRDGDPGGSGGGGASAGGTGALVWDLDTMLPFPCPLEDYARTTLLPIANRRYQR